jgi:hypothetical protein
MLGHLLAVLGVFTLLHVWAGLDHYSDSLPYGWLWFGLSVLETATVIGALELWRVTWSN